MKKRFGVSFSDSALTRLDRFIRERKYANRSEAIEHIIKKELDNTSLKEERDASGFASVTVCYNHHKRELSDKLTSIQHSYLNIIKCSQHVHVDHETCAEVIMCMGKKNQILKFYKDLIQQRSLINHNIYFFQST